MQDEGECNGAVQHRGLSKRAGEGCLETRRGGSSRRRLPRRQEDSVRMSGRGYNTETHPYHHYHHHHRCCCCCCCRCWLQKASRRCQGLSVEMWGTEGGRRSDRTTKGRERKGVRHQEEGEARGHEDTITRRLTGRAAR